MSAKDLLTIRRSRAKSLSTKPGDVRPFSSGALDGRMIDITTPWGLTKPLHILVGSKNARKAARDLRCHIASGRFPNGSFIPVAPGFQVASPELCFMQEANELSLPELIVLGFEFCGRYRLDKIAEPDRGFRDDDPLTSVAALGAFITKATGLKGRTNALKALPFIADNAASPMETVLTMLLTLPYRLGGYGFDLPKLNYPLEIDTKAARASGKRRFCCDLYWPDSQVDLEYDSDSYHQTSKQHEKDAVRRTVLSSGGIEVITVSRAQIMQTLAMHAVAETLSKKLKRRLRLPLPEFNQSRFELRRHLLQRNPRA